MAFNALKNYYNVTNNLLSTNGIIELVNQVHENKNSIRELQEKTVVIDNELSKVILNFVDPSTYKHYLFKNVRD